MLSRRALAIAPALLAAPPLLVATRGRAAQRFAAALELARGFDQLHCLIVAHGGETVVEEVFSGPPADRPVNVKSVSKTVVAALLGAAIDRGDVPGVRAALGEVAPGLIPAGADPRVADLTLEDLVTMRAGLERTSGANYGAWVSSGNWVADALSRPFVAEPGGRMLYSTGSFHVLGAALAEATGQSLLAQARARLGGPLGIEIPPWTRDPQGYYLGGNQMALSPRAMLRFGEMARQRGRWEGAQVLPEPWLEASFEPRTRSPWSGLGYGYGWFVGRAGGGPLALARGYGGQVIAVAPAAGMTVAITSDPTRPARSAGYFGDLMGLIGRLVAA
ncbi:class C beta-lactamase-related serine hydrolase [Rhodovulum sp. 12E13]|uniref:serine hydrolase domain-containing protein n=1 Tax=Rhodovulum sp. 12E13 TaxID=2203891 RepID=UPI000E1977DD|nr:serine hydrolase [Rhodovulum sp. 12E13]RDC71591.1 class C beta-lactamase-related serine hydrolase [Rhodovulum sp. 12E13]